MLSPSSIHLGILAAFIVLFVPMFLAGIHLSRNKMLFFSCSLFISLAIVVHVSPYLPSLLPVGRTPSPIPFTCLSSLHHSTATCRFHHFSRLDALDFLNGSSISIAGDSQCRLFTLSLLSLLLDSTAIDDVRSDLFKRHSDYQIQIHERSIKIDFVWSPFELNVSRFFRTIESSKSNSVPDVVVAGSGLWHMLHVTDPADYGGKLREIGKEAEKVGVLEHLFWLGLPELVEMMLNTEEKRLKMNKTMHENYEKEVSKAGILRENGGKFLLIDVGFLSRECGAKCAEDGMHYDRGVYDAAVQVMLNALLIESQQRV